MTNILSYKCAFLIDMYNNRYTPYERSNIIGSNRNRPNFRENNKDRNGRPWSQNNKHGKSFPSASKSSSVICLNSNSSHLRSLNDKPFTLIHSNPGVSEAPLNIASAAPVRPQNNCHGTGSRKDIFSKICLKQTNYYMFNKMNATDSLKIAFLFAAARCVYENEECDSVIPVIAAAEYVSEYLSEDKVIHGREADSFFENVMRKAVIDPRFNKKIRSNEDLHETLAEMGVSKNYPPSNPENITGEQYMNILRILIEHLNVWHANCDLTVTLIAIIPCVLREKLTNNFAKNIEKVILGELNKRVVINNVSIDLFFKNFVSSMEDDNIAEMVALLRSALPEEKTAPQLVDLLRRKPGGGLLPITLIGKALKECPDFPWRTTMELYPDDWKAVDKAIRVICGDKFYGYLKDQDPDVDSKNYENLSWIAKSLCEQKLDDNYDDYDEWVKVPKKEDEANMLISEYLSVKKLCDD